MVLCGMQGVNLKTDTVKILKINFSYNASFENYDNYNNHIIEIKKTYWNYGEYHSKELKLKF